MDRLKETTNLIREYHRYKNTLDIKAFIQSTCSYFDKIKNLELSKNEIQLLYIMANEVGIPQYFDLLEQKFQNYSLKMHEDVNLITLGAVLNDASLMEGDNTKLHRFQKEVLNKFDEYQENRFLLSAPTSFGKTFLVYKILKKKKYKNIVLIFPTISLLSENYQKLIEMVNDGGYFSEYQLHTLSNEESKSDKNIWIYTPERFLSYIDNFPSSKFDFIFIDEIYKIDNEYIIDDEQATENERDIAYRVCLEFSCQKAKDILLAGPYMKIDGEEKSSIAHFLEDRRFRVIDFNNIEIVNKEVFKIKGKEKYILGNVEITINRKNKLTKIASVISALTTKAENTIVYVSRKTQTESYARNLIDLIELRSTENSSFFDIFIEHLKGRYRDDWIVVKALENGIGIHHALIPKYIQKQIIDFFNTGCLQVLISTTTITEGVNTSAKNIIVTSAKKGIKPLKKFDAKNIAGRAGRFSFHYSGRVIIIDNDFDDILKGDNDTLNHKNYDINSIKNDVDYQITDNKYLDYEDRQKRDQILKMINDRGIEGTIFNKYKTISILSKIKLYDEIMKLDNNSFLKIEQLIQKYSYKKNIDWDGFQLVIDLLQPIVTDKKLLGQIETHCNDGMSKFSILTPKVDNYLKKGYFGVLKYLLENSEKNNIDASIRKTSDLVYTTFKYQLVKYLGIFDLIYRNIKSKRKKLFFEETTGISNLVSRLENNVTTDNARILSDYGVPFVLVEYYDNQLTTKKNFDNYEKYIDNQVNQFLDID